MVYWRKSEQTLREGEIAHETRHKNTPKNSEKNGPKCRCEQNTNRTRKPI